MTETREERELRTGEIQYIKPLPPEIWAHSSRNMMLLLDFFEKKRRREGQQKRKAK